MSFERSLLQITKHRKAHDKYAKVVKLEALDALTATILTDQGRYFREHPGVDTIQSAAFFQWFRDFAHPKLPDEKRTQFKLLIDTLTPDVEQSIADGFMERVLAAEASYDILSLVERYQSGEEMDFSGNLRDLVDRLEAEAVKQVKTAEVMDDVEDLLEMDRNDQGLHWRLDCLNLSIRPLRGGDFGVVAGRPDKGKTTFGTSEMTFMAQQLDDLFPEDPGRPAIWLNNEGPGHKIKKRMVQSALALTTTEMVPLAQAHSPDNTARSALMHQFNEVTHGGFSRIRVYDIHDYWSHEVEDIIKRTNAGLVFLDMVDNIRFGGDAANNGSRTDQLLEAMYQWARVIAVKHNCVVIAFSQISADGDGMAYPTLSMLKDSKTGKQGAADFIITLGASNDPVLEGIRYIGCTKNKLVRDGERKDPRSEVIFDGPRGRYTTPGA